MTHTNTLCMCTRGVCSVARCSFRPFLVTHFVMRFSQIITAPHLIFMVTWEAQYLRRDLNNLKPLYFPILGFFFPIQNWFFSFILGQVLNYWAIFYLFWAIFPNQHLLGLLNYIYIENYWGQKKFLSDKWDLYWVGGLNRNSTMSLMHGPKAIGENPKNSLYFMPWA